MRTRIAIVYNEPLPSRYDAAGEGKAIQDVINTVSAVHQALLELGYDVIRLPLSPPFNKANKKLRSLEANLVFNLFEGFCGYPETEALVPEALSEMGVIFTGCPHTALSLALDKARVKVLLKDAGIPTPDFQLLDHHMIHMFHLNFPCIVKPRSDDASHGITEKSMVHNFTSLEEQVRTIAESYGSSALVEEFVSGREFNATVMSGSVARVLPVSEIVYSLPAEMPRILSFAAKWEPDSLYFQGTRAVCPANIEAEEQKYICRTALEAFRVLRCRGYARVDMRMDGQGRLNVIELNPNPDISPGNGAARQAGAAGMAYARFIAEIVELAMENNNHDNYNPPYVEEGQISTDANTAGYARVQSARTGDS